LYPTSLSDGTMRRGVTMADVRQGPSRFQIKSRLCGGGIATMMWGAMAVTPHIEAAWLHAFDDVTPGASLAFATTGIGFAVDSVPLAEDSAILNAGLDVAISERLTAAVSYTGQHAEKFSDNGVKGRFTWLFN
jgi:outer membrane autotransporter protein